MTGMAIIVITAATVAAREQDDFGGRKLHSPDQADMKHPGGLGILVLLVLSGCASLHFVQEWQHDLVFHLRMPGATRVQFASSADNFRLHDARPTRDGDWQVVVPVQPELTYFYLVDGAMYLPECTRREKDDFGMTNCVYRPLPRPAGRGQRSGAIDVGLCNLFSGKALYSVEGTCCGGGGGGGGGGGR